MGCAKVDEIHSEQSIARFYDFIICHPERSSSDRRKEERSRRILCDLAVRLTARDSSTPQILPSVEFASLRMTCYEIKIQNELLQFFGMLSPSTRVLSVIIFLMHYKNLVRTFGAFVILIAIAVSPAHAQNNQPPSGQFGVGISLITNYLPNELAVTYALDSTMQFGAGFYLSLSAGSSGTYLVSPYARYLFPDLFPGIASPFVQGGIQLYSPGTGTQVGIFAGGGVAYTINHQINVHGDIDIVNLFLSSAGVTDWFVFRIGADYFF